MTGHWWLPILAARLLTATRLTKSFCIWLWPCQGSSVGYDMKVIITQSSFKYHGIDCSSDALKSRRRFSTCPELPEAAWLEAGGAAVVTTAGEATVDGTVWRVELVGTCNRYVAPATCWLTLGTAPPDKVDCALGCCCCATAATFCSGGILDATTGEPTVVPATGPGPTRKSWYCPFSVLTSRWPCAPAAWKPLERVKNEKPKS